MKKKVFLSICLALMTVILPLSSTQVVWAETSGGGGTDDAAKFKLAMPENTPGLIDSADNTVEIPIYVEKNDGINTLGITITYNSSVLYSPDFALAEKYDKAVMVRDKDKPTETTFSDVDSKVSGTINAAFVFDGDVTSTEREPFATLTFKIDSGATVGKYEEAVKITVNNVTDYEGSTDGPGKTESGTDFFGVEFTEAEGKGAVTTANLTVVMLGDVNMDGRINLLDVLYVVEYYDGGKRELDENQLLAANVTKDAEGAINLDDAKKIVEYCHEVIKRF